MFFIIVEASYHRWNLLFARLVVISKIKAAGFKYSSQILFNRIVPEKLFRCRRFQILELPPVDRATAKAQTTVRWATTEQDLRLTQELTGVRLDATAHRTRCCLAVVQKEIAGSVWCASYHFEEKELGLEIRLGECQFWIFSAYVSHTYRRRGIYGQMLAFVTNELISEQSAARFWLAINPDNRRSLAAHTCLHAKPAARVLAIRAGSMGLCRCRSAEDSGIQVVRSRTGDCWQRPLAIEIA